MSTPKSIPAWLRQLAFYLADQYPEDRKTYIKFFSIAAFHWEDFRDENGAVEDDDIRATQKKKREQEKEKKQEIDRLRKKEQESDPSFLLEQLANTVDSYQETMYLDNSIENQIEGFARLHISLEQKRSRIIETESQLLELKEVENEEFDDEHDESTQPSPQPTVQPCRVFIPKPSQ